MRKRISIIASVISFILCICLLPTFAQKNNAQKSSVNLQEKIAKKLSAVSKKGADKKAPKPQIRNMTREESRAGSQEVESIVLTPHPYVRSTVQLVPQVGHPVKFAVTAPVRTFTPATAFSAPAQQGVVEEKEMPDLVLVDPHAKRSADAAILRPKADVPASIPAPSLIFNGVSNIDNFNAFGGRVLPPDTNGDVGPNHYVQDVNLLTAIYDKTGVIQPGSPFKISSLFAPLGGACATLDNGDPVVLYDQLSDRWLISQFAVPNPFHQCIAISQTGDPTGAYFVYDFIMPGGKFNDYPKFGWGSDALYMTDHQFNAAGTAFLGSGVFAFDKAKLLAGDPTASFIYFDLQPLDPALFGHLMPDADGMTPPEPGHTYVFHMLSDEGGYGLDAIQIFDFTYDFTNPASSTFVERADSPVTVPAYDPTFNESGAAIPGCTGGNSRDDFPQPPPSTDCTRLDSVGNRLMHRVQSRNFGSHTDFVLNESVDVTPTENTRFDYVGGVRVYKLRLSGGTFTLQQAFTVSLDTDDRFMGAVAMDANGNMGIGYTVTSLTTMPAVRYSGVTAGDTFLGEGSIAVGAGVQTNTASRWGDYSGMNVDPTDECTFWYTQEYYTATGELCGATTSNACWKTVVGKFNLGAGAPCTTPATGTINGNVTNLVGGAPIAGAVVTATDTTTLGSVSATTDGAGNYSRNIAPGTYDLVATKPGFAPSLPVNVTVAASGTVTTNFALDPLAVIALGPITIDDSASNNNGLIDPNECDNLTIQLNNNGVFGGDATNVTATLVSNTVGVTVPASNATQTWPTIPAGANGTNGVPFEISVSPVFPCGQPIHLTLQGSSDDGQFSIPITLPTNIVSTVTSFSATGPVPILDLSTATLPITVSGVSSFSRIRVRVFMTHSWDGDINASLIGPDGVTTINLSDDNGGSADNYGTDCPADGNDTTFDDNAAVSIIGSAAPFVGSFRPEQPLSTMNTQNPNGDWTLSVFDDANGDTGAIQCWTLEFINDSCTPGTGVCAGSVPVLNKTGEAIANDTNGDGNVDSNECFDLNVDLQNVGTASATAIAGTLSTSTPGVTILNGSAAYSDIAPGASGTNTTPFQLRTGIGYDCLQPIALTLDVATASGNFSYPITITPDSGNGVPVPFAYAGPPVPIPDNNSGGASASVNVSGVSPANLYKVTATLHISHTWSGDLILSLIGPDSTVVPLAVGRGASSDGYGTDCPADGNDTTFDDDASTPVGSVATCPAGVPCFVGSFRPDGSLANFRGIDPNGTWTLHVVDTGGGDTGNIECWSLSVQPVGCQDGGCITCNVTITPGSVPNATLGVAYNQTLTGNGGSGPYTFAVASGTLPPGLSLDSAGNITGTPTALGVYNFDVSATDSLGCIGTHSFSISVTCPVISLNPGVLPDAPRGVPYNQTISASGGTPPYTLSLAGGSLPNGLNFNAGTGAITGTPTNAGTSTFTIHAVDANGCAESQTYTITVPCAAITLTPATLPDGVTGVPYSQTIVASGGNGAITFSLAGVLPAGLSLNTATGAITGTPTASGTSSFTINATDIDGCSGSRDYTINISCAAITLSPTTLPDGTLGTAYSQTITASGGTAPFTFSIAGSLPAGLNLDTNTGAITGTPTAVETATFTITATDANGCTGSRDYSINVLRNCLFCDEFNDGVLATDWTYTGAWSEDNDNLETVAGSKKATAIGAPAFAGCLNCSVATSVSIVGTSTSRVWIYGWWVDKKNDIELLIKEANNKIILKQRTGGSIVKKQSAPVTINPNTFYAITMTFNGTTIVVNVDGTDVITFTPVGAVPSGTVGFGGKNSSDEFGYIRVN